VTKLDGVSRAVNSTTSTVLQARTRGLRTVPTSRGSTRTRQTPTQRRFSKIAAAINQKARSLDQPGRVTAEDLAIVFLAAEGECTYCTTGIDADGVSFDHVVPFSRGGVNAVSNLVACCITCQRTKFTKTPEQLAEWMQLVRYCLMCQQPFRPRWADYVRGLGYYDSRSCSGRAGGLTS
jgi:5-methylcytosine-specific restriction endonuclease McrA